MTSNQNPTSLSSVFLNDERLLQLEQSSNDYLRKTQRRASMFVSSCTDEALLQIVAADKEYYIELVGLVEAYRQHLKMLSDMTEQALNRLNVINYAKSINYPVDATK